MPTAEAQPFSLPELPVAINLRELDFPSITFAEPVFGQAAVLRAGGSVTLARGALDTTLDVERLDQPGGTMRLKAAFSNQTRQLDVDVALQEPQGGVVATLLKIEGAPAIDLRLQGSGPLDDVDVRFSLDADALRIAEGVVALRSGDEGLGFTADFSGGLSPLIPPEFRDFFAGESSVAVHGVKKASGGLRIDQMAVKGAVLDLSGNLETGPDNFLRNLSLIGSLGDPRGPAVVLPVPGGRTKLHSAELYVRYGDASRWSGLLVLDRLQAADIEMEDVTLRLGGLALDLEDPARRRVTVTAEGLATGLWSADPDVERALGKRIDLFADAELKPGGPVELRQLQVSGNGLSIFSAGSFADLVYTGRNAIRVDDLGVFAGLADRPLGGAVDLHADGSVSPLSGGFDLTFDGSATDLAVGEARIDPLMAGETTLSGRAVRDETGFRTENLKLANAQLSFASDGQISTRRTDIGFEAALSELALVDPRLAGRLTATGRATGDGRPIAVTLSAEVPEGKLMARTLTGARIGFTGEVDGSNVTGSLSGNAALDGLVMRLGGDLAVAGANRSLTGIEVAVGPNRLSGELSQIGGAPVEGKLALHAPDIAAVAALALVEATGAIDADIGLAAADVGQGVTVRANAKGVAVGATRIGALDVDASIVDALGLPLIDGTLTGRDMALAGIDIATLSAKATHVDGTRMHLDVESRLAIGTLANLSGELVRLDDGFSVTLDRLDLRQQGVSARLTAPTTVTLAGGTLELSPLGLDVGRGNLTAQGKVGDSLDVDLTIRDLPLDIANVIRPDLAFAGTVNGSARITGPRSAPDARFQVSAAGVGSAMTRGAGLPPVTLDARGTTANGVMQLDARVAGNGLAAEAKGKVPLGPGNLDLAVDLQAFPLALVDRVAGSRGLRGTLSGRAHLTGPLADPAGTFDLRGEGLSAQVLADNDIRPLGLTASGSYRGRTLQLTQARATGADGLDLQGSGHLPFAGPGLDVRVTGTVPLSVADVTLAERSAQVAGLLHVTATARGSLTAPQFGGTFDLDGGTFVDPQTNFRLESVALDGTLEGNVAVFRSFRGNVASGGTITGQGRITLARGFPADVTLRINDARYTDGAFISTRLDGALTATGPLFGGGGLLAGQLDLGRTEISVAEGLGANAQAALDQVDHIATPPPVQQTLDRAKVGTPRSAEARNRNGIGLDLRINAPNQIFVRGRGLDVELGGNLRLQGTTTDVQPVGQFEMRRGRLLILGQRIDFDQGSLQLVGNLDPQIHFVARTVSQDVTAIVTVDGRVSQPNITFSSEPQLPEDEVLSRVLFNRATQNLSAFQLAQLAAAAAELAGGGTGPGILSQLRGATGLDDLDVITQEDGSTAVRAGKYIDENIYLDVQTDTDGVSRAEINLDINRNFTARGSVGSDGNTTLGLFFERDY